MNTLSWMIYAAGVLDSLGIALTMTLFVWMIFLGGAWVGRMVSGGMVFETDMPTDRQQQGSHDYQKWAAVRSLTQRRFLYVVPALILAALTFLPSSRTLWLIAASEAGETVVTSPDAIEMMTDLKAIIKKRLKAELGETD